MGRSEPDLTTAGREAMVQATEKVVTMFNTLAIDALCPSSVCAISSKEGCTLFTYGSLGNTYQIPDGQSPEEFVANHVQSEPHGSKDGDAHPPLMHFLSGHMTKAEIISWIVSIGVKMGASTIHVRRWPGVVEGFRAEVNMDTPTEAIVGFSFSKQDVKPRHPEDLQALR